MWLQLISIASTDRTVNSGISGKMSRNLFKIKRAKPRRVTHPDKVHLLALLHEGPNLGAEFFPHALQVMEHSQLLKGLIDLESSREPGFIQIEERQRQ